MANTAPQFSGYEFKQSVVKHNMKHFIVRPYLYSVQTTGW